MENSSAVALILAPDGKFSPSDAGSILHRQKGAPHELFIIALGASIKIPAPLEKMAKKLVRINGEASIGKTLNEILASTQNRVLAFSSNQVLPTHDHWLKRICAPIMNGKTDAVFGREIPTPGGNYFMMEEIKRNFPLSASGADAKLFSMDNCAIRRDALVRYPFPEKPLHDAAAAWLFKSKATAEYCPEALVMRHVDRSLKEVFAENRRRGADHATLGGASFPETAGLAIANIRRDLRFCLSLRKPQYMWYPFLHRLAVFFGYRTGRRLRFPDR